MQLFIKLVMLFHSYTRKAPEKLEFGCGSKLRSGYVGVDIRPLPGVKYICNSWEIERFIKHNSVKEIYSRHFLEHLTFVQVRKTLDAWRNILEKGGKLIVIVPDINYHIKQFAEDKDMQASLVDRNITNRQHALAGFWGWQREGDIEYWDVHKSGFNQKILEEMMINHGFINISRINDSPWNLHIIAYKK